MGLILHHFHPFEELTKLGLRQLSQGRGYNAGKPTRLIPLQEQYEDDFVLFYIKIKKREKWM